MEGTIRTRSGAVIYADDVHALADEYIDRKCGGDETKPAQSNAEFRKLILYIKQNMEQPDKTDVEGLNRLWGIYVGLCVEYNTLPTVELFLWLTDINDVDIYSKSNTKSSDRVTSLLISSAKKWRDTAEQFLRQDLGTSDRASVNKIFIAKAQYGMVETAPAPVPMVRQADSNAEILADLSAGRGQIEDHEQN